MKIAGQQRLRKLSNRLHELCTDNKRHEWVALIINLQNLDEPHNILVKRYQIQQYTNLHQIWSFLIQQAQDAIHNEEVLPLIQNIIRFVYLPDTTETFFANNTQAEHALLTLHTLLQKHVRIEIINALDELLLGCTSADIFLEESENPDVYKVLEEIIINVNKYAKQEESLKSIPILGHATRSRENSFSSMAALSLKQLSYISSLVDQEKQDVEKTSILEDTNHPQIVVNIPQPQLSKRIVRVLFGEDDEYEEPEWMHEGLSLSANLLEDLKKHQEYLYQKYTNEDKPHSKKIEQKLAFLDDIIHKSEHNELTPKVFYKTTRNKPELFVAFFSSKTYRLWLRVKLELIERFWQHAGQKNRFPFGYRITDTELLRGLKEKQKDFSPISKTIDYKSMPTTSRARWYQEKRAALDYLLEKNEQGLLCADDFFYVNKNFPCFSCTNFGWLRCSETEAFIKEIQNFIKNLLWADAGGDGPKFQNKVRTHQQSAACDPAERRALWAGNNL